MTFTADLTKYAEKTKSDIGTAKRAIVFNVFKEVIKKTPVDTGRAKANWFVTEGAPSKSVSTKRSKAHTGNIGINETYQLGLISTDIGVDFLTNNLPYIKKLEYCGSSQAPSGMVRTTLREFIQIANKQGWS